jgi:hypothetical protein
MFRAGDGEETCICTWARLSMEPGTVVVERKFVAEDGGGDKPYVLEAATGLIATAEPLTMPVVCAGAVMPSPFKKIVTVEPEAAGLAQLFWVPSALRARGCKPEAGWPLHMVLSKTGWLKAGPEMKTLGWRSTTARI